MTDFSDSLDQHMTRQTNSIFCSCSGKPRLGRFVYLNSKQLNSVVGGASRCQKCLEWHDAIMEVPFSSQRRVSKVGSVIAWWGAQPGEKLSPPAHGGQLPDRRGQPGVIGLCSQGAQTGQEEKASSARGGSGWRLGKISSPEGVVRPWRRLPRAVVESAFLEMLKICVGVALGDMVQWLTWQCWGMVGLKRLFQPWQFCDRFKGKQEACCLPLPFLLVQLGCIHR